MLSQRTLELRPGSPGLPQTLITREVLLDSGHASALLEQARNQAEQVLIDAQQQRTELLERASLEFWQRANAQLSAWEQERQAMCQAFEQNATLLVNQALRCLLEKVPAATRLCALLKQLSATQNPPVDATLRCHPSGREAIQKWLGEHQDIPWRLQSDDKYPPQELVLETDEGDFRINWTSATEALLLPEDPATSTALL